MEGRSARCRQQTERPSGRLLASLDPPQSKYTDLGLTFAKGELNKRRKNDAPPIQRHNRGAKWGFNVRKWTHRQRGIGVTYAELLFFAALTQADSLWPILSRSNQLGRRSERDVGACTREVYAFALCGRKHCEPTSPGPRCAKKETGDWGGAGLLFLSAPLPKPRHHTVAESAFWAGNFYATELTTAMLGRAGPGSR